jgi:ABC-2 type transport system ATP-binding protein
MKIQIKNLSKSFKGITILDNVSIEFESGKIYGLIGRNGSGKSVFLKLLCNFYVPTSGEILYDGLNINEKNIFLPDTRALIEKPSFLPDLSGFDNLKLLASIQGKIGDKEINESLKKVNLFDDKDKKYKIYSLGMKQKLGIAQVLMEDTKVMILDEPFNGIEEKTADKLRNILKEEVKKDKIIIIASHIKEDVFELADVVYKFDDGKVEICNK